MIEFSRFIAVVDDDESMCLALCRLLRAAGYEARAYFSAESFLDDPDHASAGFVVADIQLRGMSGFDLQGAVHRDTPAMPFAFITAHDEAETRSQAAASGCAAYLRKPFPASDLLTAITTNLPPKQQAT